MTSNLTKSILDARNKGQDGSVRRPIKRITALKKVGGRQSTEKSLRLSVDGENVFGPAAVVVPPKNVLNTSRIRNKVVKKSKKTRSDETKPPRSAAAAADKRIVSTKAAVEVTKIRNSDEGRAAKHTNGKIGKSSASNNDEKIHEKTAAAASMPKATRKQTASAKAVVVKPSAVRNVAADDRDDVPRDEGKVQVRRQTVTKTVGESSLDTGRKGHGVIKRKKATRSAAKDMNSVDDVRVQDAVKKATTTTTTLKLDLPQSTSKPIVKTKKPFQADDAIAAVISSIVAVDPPATAAVVKKSVFLSKLCIQSGYSVVCWRLEAGVVLAQLENALSPRNHSSQ